MNSPSPQTPAPRGLIVFDLDGTLVDTIDDLTASGNRLLASLGAQPVTPQIVRPMVGDGVPALVRRLLAHAGITTGQADAIARFSEDYEHNAANASRMFPGVMQTLIRLRTDHWSLAVCTNKPAGAAASLLAALGIAPMLAAIGGGDSFPTRKPDPGHLLGTIHAAGFTPQSALLVGDHANDVAAARGAHVPCIFARWGYGRAEMADGCSAEAAHIEDVPALAADLLGASNPRTRQGFLLHSARTSSPCRASDSRT